MLLLRYLGIALVPVMLGACSSMAVTTDYDPQADFTKLKTYRWMPRDVKTGDPRIDDNTLLETRVVDATDQVLSAKGYRRLGPEGTPDFLIGWFATLDTKTDTTVINNYYHYPSGGWYPNAPMAWGAPSTYVYQYEEGTLILDIVDPATKALLWRGSARDEVHFSDSPGRKEKHLKEALDRLFAKFPPKAE